MIRALGAKFHLTQTLVGCLGCLLDGLFGNTTTYQHLSKRSVSVGAVVKQGQAIGVTGSSGVGSGPHLHFEITENGQLVNPLKYLTDYVKAWR